MGACRPLCPLCRLARGGLASGLAPRGWRRHTISAPLLRYYSMDILFFITLLIVGLAIHEATRRHGRP